VVREAREWIGTPYVEAGRVKGPNGGCDCASLIAEVLTLAGIIPREELGFYGRGFSSEEAQNANYMFRIVRHARQIMEVVGRYRSIEEGIPEPGNVVIVAVNTGLYNHGGFVTTWPFVVHAMHPKVAEWNVASDCCGVWTGQKILVFDPFAKWIEETAGQLRS
jgi:cell wall-associated NlpC family hydrolase